ncbi:DUF1080 domain-containing protein [Parvularcula flava]|uniref:DUF1080 domain-containing protein n=1 Tax=Aquisalinus luteolus TaxID=1566827 RepID=A0A8J3A0Z7_9PROT|nr:DUF1080 domain-containing protein [Aquisalinus luteolus]NHK26300.1 DUF1080 domain-containing protein [Aquisalinus luteolus]GGH91914.1 hypothetical protein GCM10011355_00180 [Aquisalinus luteolus]
MTRMISRTVLVSAGLALAACSASQDDASGDALPSDDAAQVDPGTDQPGISLFDGETLDGWEQTSGVASYHVEDGSIVGTTAVGWPNSFLVVDGKYGDFILTMETRSDGVVNSGVQFRSGFFEDPADGMVGYQVDFDPSARRWSGGIYHEGVDIWRYSLIRNPDCIGAWHDTDWNDLRIQAIGDNIKTWVNGTPCVDMYDRSHAAGRIGLQVHGIVEEAEAGSITEWRNIRLISGDELEAAMSTAHEAPVEGWLANELSPGEIEQGWQLHWDGASTVEAGGWSVDDGKLVASAGAAPVEFSAQAGAQTISFDFGLMPQTSGEAVYRITAAGGDASCEGSFALRYEGEGVGETLPRTAWTGALTGDLPSENLSNDTRFRRIYDGDKMNRGRIVLRDGQVEHWLNGVQTVIYPLSRCEAFAATQADYSIASLSMAAQEGDLAIQSVKSQ